MARLVKRPSAWWVGAALSCAAAIAGDWLSTGGDPQHSGWQRRGKLLTTASIKDLKLLWKRQLDSGPLTAPVIVGPTITHRGVRELVFVGGGRDDLYAIDADLGTLFWRRHFETNAAAGAACGSGAMATPVIEPDPNEARRDDDEPGRMRPVYAVASDGRLHKVRPSDGADMEDPMRFLPPHSNASDLNLWSHAVFAATSGGCEGAKDGVWRIAHATVDFAAAGGDGGVTIGADGTVYHAAGEKIMSFGSGGPWRVQSSFTASGNVSLAPMVFKWKEREMLVAGTRRQLFFLNAADLDRVVSIESASEFAGSPATWQDAAGTRWIYTTGVAIRAFQMTGAVKSIWESRDVSSPGSPVVTNGMVFTLTGGSHATLIALDAATGKQLYSSRETVTAAAQSRELAVANGHVCFVTTDNMLYCFGIPIE